LARVIGLDGRSRSEEEERRINLTAVSVLGDQDGKDLMAYLRSITIEAVAGPNISDAELRHLEGQRYIVGLLSQRVNQGHKAKHNVNDKG